MMAKMKAEIRTNQAKADTVCKGNEGRNDGKAGSHDAEQPRKGDEQIRCPSRKDDSQDGLPAGEWRPQWMSLKKG
jgi:hypothetical protein